MYTTNEWYTTAKAIDKKICNKIIELANNNWQPSTVDTAGDTTDEERKTGRKGDYKSDPKLRIS